MDSASLNALFTMSDVRDPSAGALATIGCVVTFYFTDVRAVQPSLPRLYEDIVDMMGANARYIVAGTAATRARKFRVEDRNLVARWLKSTRGSQEYAVALRSGLSARGAGPWSLELSTEAMLTADARRFFDALKAKGAYEPDPQGPRASYVHFTVPVNVVLANCALFRDRVLGMVGASVFRCGYVGFGLVYNERAAEYHRDQVLPGWIKRFHGLDPGSPRCSARFISKGIRGVSWLTMLDHELLAKVGGREAVEALGPDITVHPLPHGVMIQAGEAPRLGDVNELEDMTPYVKVNRLLKPIRAEDMYPPPGMRHEEAREWLARFDEP